MSYEGSSGLLWGDFYQCSSINSPSLPEHWERGALGGLLYKGDPACARIYVAHGYSGKCVCIPLLFLSNGWGRGYAEFFCSVLKTEHGLYAAGLYELQFEDDNLFFAVKVLSLLKGIFSTLFDSLSAFVWEGSVVPNLLTSGVMGLPTVIQTMLSCNDGFGPLLCLYFEVFFVCTSKYYLGTGPWVKWETIRYKQNI